MLRIAIAGLGTVGTGVVRLLQQNAALISARAGQDIKIVAVSDRNKARDRGCDFSNIAWIDDARQIAELPDVDVMVELIGGSEGVALELAEAALKKGRHFVTANKALLAAHGAKLARLAEDNKAQMMFEASVAGGIPAIKSLREGLAANQIVHLRGILNGTCNYILTLMQSEGLSFEKALADAQAKGFAEADPSADIDGHDTANKLAILTALAYGVEPALSAVAVEGIRHIMALDLKLAAELGYRIKLLGTARSGAEGIAQNVGPCLVPVSSPLAQVHGAMNAVLLRGDFVGEIMLQGAGAGSHPTASAVVADLIDLARGSRLPAFGIPASKLAVLKPAKAALLTKYYLRLHVVDKPGVVADIAAILRDEAISIESFVQHGHVENTLVPLVITTHAADDAAIRRAASKIATLAVVSAPPCVMRIED